MNAAVRQVCLDLTPTEMLDRFGGFSIYAVDLLRELLALAPTATAGLEIVVWPRSDRPPRAIDSAGVDRLLEEIRGRPIISPRRHRLQRRVLGGPLLRRAGIDLFHGIVPAALPVAIGCPRVVTSHDIIDVVYPKRPLGSLGGRWESARARLRQASRHRAADHIIAISNTTARDLVRLLPLDERRISVVHEGIDLRRFGPNTDSKAAERERAAVAKLHGLPGRYLLSVSSDHYRKNQPMLFEAWRELVLAGVDVGLVLVGRSLYGATFQELSRRAERERLAGFRWLDKVEDDQLPSLYRHAEMVVAPSRYEGFGLTLLEAMACGAPVLAARAGSHQEVGGEAAEYFDPDSSADLVAILRRLLEDAARLEAMRERGLAHVHRFTWRATAEQTLEIYRRLLGMSRR